jgi:RHS repeat-associated protein
MRPRARCLPWCCLAGSRACVGDWCRQLWPTNSGCSSARFSANSCRASPGKSSARGRLTISSASSQHSAAGSDWGADTVNAFTKEGCAMPQLPADNHTPSQQSRTVLLAADNKNSILAEVAGGKPDSIAYSAYGQQSAQQDVATTIGFNGELREPHLGWYLLGNGYRAYNPTLMRFHSPDSWSPFGEGGLNAYMYCVGDPVNSSDPTGHSRIGKLLWGAYDFLFGGPGATGSGRPLLNGPMSPEKTGELTGLIIAGAPVAAAPRPRGDIISEGARMTSVASENLGRPGYADGAALGGLTALGNRSITRSASQTPNLASRITVESHQFGRDAITTTYSNGRSVTRPRQPVRGGGCVPSRHASTPGPSGSSHPTTESRTISNIYSPSPSPSASASASAIRNTPDPTRYDVVGQDGVSRITLENVQRGLEGRPPIHRPR